MEADRVEGLDGRQSREGGCDSGGPALRPTACGGTNRRAVEAGGRQHKGVVARAGAMVDLDAWE